VLCHRGPLLKICISESRAGVASRSSRSKTFLRTEEWRPDGDGRWRLSGFDLSMGCVGELGIGGARIAANAHALSTFFCSCQPSPPFMAKRWAGRRAATPWTTRWTDRRQGQASAPANGTQFAAICAALAVICNDLLSPTARRALPARRPGHDFAPMRVSKPHLSHHGASEQPAGGLSKRDYLYVQRSFIARSPSHLMSHCAAADAEYQNNKSISLYFLRTIRPSDDVEGGSRQSAGYLLWPFL